MPSSRDSKHKPARQSSRRRPKATSDKSDNSSSDTGDTPTWDCDLGPGFESFLEELEDHIYGTYRSARQLFVKGTVSSRDNKKVVESDTHLIDIKAGTITLGSFESPTSAFLYERAHSAAAGSSAVQRLVGAARSVSATQGAQVSQAGLGLQGQEKWQAQGSPMRSGLLTNPRCRL